MDLGAKFYCKSFCQRDTIRIKRIPYRSTKIPKGQTEIVKSEDRKDHGQQNEMKYKHRKQNTTLKTKAGVTRTLKNKFCQIFISECNQMTLT